MIQEDRVCGDCRRPLSVVAMPSTALCTVACAGACADMTASMRGARTHACLRVRTQVLRHRRACTRYYYEVRPIPQDPFFPNPNSSRHSRRTTTKFWPQFKRDLAPIMIRCTTCGLQPTGSPCDAGAFRPRCHFPPLFFWKALYNHKPLKTVPRIATLTTKSDTPGGGTPFSFLKNRTNADRKPARRRQPETRD
jgi:hypothetical protein